MNKQAFKLFDLGPSGLAKIQDSLSDGLSLSKEVLKRIPAGRVLTFLPERFPLDKAVEMIHAGGLPLETDPAQALNDYLRVQLGEHNILAICEDELARLGDPTLNTRQGNMVCVEDKILHWAWFFPGQTWGLPKFIRYSSAGYPTNAFLVLADKEPKWGRFQEIRGEDITSLASRVVAIICSAYDAEAFICLLSSEHFPRTEIES